MVGPYSSLFAPTKVGVSRNILYTLLYIDDLGLINLKPLQPANVKNGHEA